MKKIFFIFIVFVFNAVSAYGDELITSNTLNGCVFNSDKVLFARFEPDRYTCNAGYYLPADATNCASCLTGYTCAGGTYSFNENTDQGISINMPITTNVGRGCGTTHAGNRFVAQFEPNQYTCNVGYYLPADAIECVQCPSENACVGGTYSFNETISQGIQSCASDTYSPTGSAVCYPHILHVGNDVVYLKSTKQTTPSLNFQIGNDIFYAHMTTVPTKMNKDSTHYFHAQWENNDYYICDDTTCPQ